MSLFVQSSMDEIDPMGRFTWALVDETDDIKKWGVVIYCNDVPVHSESVMSFPSDKCIAKMMLLGA